MVLGASALEDKALPGQEEFVKRISHFGVHDSQDPGYWDPG